MTTYATTVERRQEPESTEEEHRVDRVDLLRIVVVAAAAVAVLLVGAEHSIWLFLFGAVVLGFGAWPVCGRPSKTSSNGA